MIGKANPAKTKIKEDAGKGPNTNSDLTSKGNTYLSDIELKDLNWHVGPLYFEYGQAELRNETVQLLDQNLDVLKSNKQLKVMINGFADSRGSAEYNKMLSYKRANSIKKYFTSHGISQSRIIGVNGFGETQLVNHCSDEANCSEEEHAANRRVEFKIMNQGNKTPITIK
jgi:outer membrane protein OmpA-like peptidoglycan-associated protein